jgi:aspartate racemase
MKQIGLLGGTSWPSTIDYYKLLNQMAAERLGGHHSARILLQSIDYHEIKSRYGARWAEVPPLLKAELDSLAAKKPDCIVICNNTLHKGLDALGYEADVKGVPVIHIVNETGKAAQAAGHKRVLLLGTKFTMEDGYYEGKLENDFALDVETPNETHRNEIQAMQARIAAGENAEQFESSFAALLKYYKSFDAVVLACTELPLVVTERVTTLPILNPTLAQCRAAMDFALK